MKLTSATPGELAEADGAPRELEGDVGGAGLTSRVRARHAKLVADRNKVFPLPGYEGVFEVHYKRLPTDDVDAVLTDPEIAEMNERYAQFLINATLGLYALEDDGVTRMPLTNGRPLAWDDVARIIDPTSKAGSLRGAIVEVVFDGNDHELRDHGDDVYCWTKGAHKSALDLIAGE